MRIPADWLPALEANRMLILEMRKHQADLASAEARNRFVLAQAAKRWIPHATPGGMIDRLTRAGNKHQFYNRFGAFFHTLSLAGTPSHPCPIPELFDLFIFPKLLEQRLLAQFLQVARLVGIGHIPTVAGLGHQCRVVLGQVAQFLPVGGEVGVDLLGHRAFAVVA